MTKLVYTLVFVCQFSMQILGQEWIFQVKPNIKVFSISTFRESQTGYHNTDQTFIIGRYKNQKNYAFLMQEAIVDNRIGKYVEGEIAIDFRRTKFKGLNFGLGWSTFNHYFVPMLGARDITGNQSLFTIRWPDPIVNFYNQYFFYASFSPDKKTRRLRNQIITGLTVNIPFKSNIQEMNQFSPDNLPNFKGFYYIVEKHQRALDITPSLLLRYELGLFSKKGQHIFNLNFTYHQGFVKDLKYTLRAEFENGPIFNHSFTNRVSGFRMGISRTITVLKK